MSTENETPIRYRPDGSIDTAHYLAIGRDLRSGAAHDLFHGAVARLNPVLRLARILRHLRLA